MIKVREQWQLIVGLFFLALVIRLYGALNTVVISRDGTLYIAMARQFFHEGWQEGLSAGFYPPLYPWVISLSMWIFDDAELAAKLTSALFGSLTVFPAYLLYREMADEQVARWGAFLYVIHPYLINYSSDVIAEGTYIFFFTSAVLMASRAIGRPSTAHLTAVGCATALSYLTRPEGVGVLFLLLAWLVYRCLAGRAISFSRLAVGAVALFLPFLIIVMPYLMHIRLETGEWRLNEKWDMAKGFKLMTPVETSVLTGDPVGDQGEGKKGPALRPERWKRHGKLTSEVAARLYYHVRYFHDFYHPITIFLLLAAIMGKGFRRYSTEKQLFILSIVIAYILLFSLLYFSKRHMMQIVTISLFWPAIGVIEASAWIRRQTLLPLRYREQAAPMMIGLVAIGFLPHALKTQRLDKLPLKEAGRWIAAHNVKSPLILSSDLRIAFYAEGRHQPISEELEGKTMMEQVPIVEGVLNQAEWRRARFVFLKGSLHRDARTAILKSRGSDSIEIKDWRNVHGRGYTLIRLKKKSS